eukprot:XP_001694579.1 predicted protein [Chlamydomonas reinhardtii]
MAWSGMTGLCMRGAALQVVGPGEDAASSLSLPPLVPTDSSIRGRAQELHRQLSHLREPMLVPRDQCLVNLDFDLRLDSTLATVLEAGGGSPTATAGEDAAAAAAAAAGTGSPAFKGHEQRLRERLERLNLDMLIVAGDGNCQFRSVSNELYGTQEHHAAIRRQAVAHIVSQRDSFECFLGEDFDVYVRQMSRSGTWGDELTLRAVCDSFGLTVHVVTSDVDHGYLTYEPEDVRYARNVYLGIVVLT